LGMGTIVERQWVMVGRALQANVIE
jgi:hypothetical protein